jgi:hypothetical protein
MIVPTRDVVSEQYPKPVAYGKDANLITKSIGTYHHYKFRPFDIKRVDAGYSVGDRIAPRSTDYKDQQYTGAYPSVITERFEPLLNS